MPFNTNTATHNCPAARLNGRWLPMVSYIARNGRVMVTRNTGLDLEPMDRLAIAGDMDDAQEIAHFMKGI